MSRVPTRTTVAMAAAFAGLALAAFATVRSARYPRVTAADDTATQAELVRLRGQVDTLSRAVAHLRAAPAAAPLAAPAATAPDGAAPTVDGAPPAVPADAPSYRAFEAPHGISVSTSIAGALAIHNSDPSLTGQVVTITGERDDGARELLTVVVPPPE